MTLKKTLLVLLVIKISGNIYIYIDENKHFQENMITANIHSREDKAIILVS